MLRAGSLDRATLASRPEVAALDRDLRQLSDGLPIVKVKIYDLKGLTVYSSDPSQIGQDKSPNPGYLRARDGYPASNLTFRERMDSWEGEIAQRHILGTYVPVHVYDASPVEAVLEVYSDVTPLVERAERSQWMILAVVLGAMALVYAVVQLILVRYQRLLAEKERERAAQEERIRYQAYHDVLTGLPNRASFGEHLEEAMRRAKRAGWPLGLLFLDLDRFKRVNDSMGHDVGDRLLQRRGRPHPARGARGRPDLPPGRRRVHRAARGRARPGGGGDGRAAACSRRWPSRCSSSATRSRSPRASASRSTRATAPIGERLLKNADTAMYRAKELGRNRYRSTPRR